MTRNQVYGFGIVFRRLPESEAKRLGQRCAERALELWTENPALAEKEANLAALYLHRARGCASRSPSPPPSQQP